MSIRVRTAANVLERFKYSLIVTKDLLHLVLVDTQLLCYMTWPTIGAPSNWHTAKPGEEPMVHNIP